MGYGKSRKKIWEVSLSYRLTVYSNRIFRLNTAPMIVSPKCGWSSGEGCGLFPRVIRIKQTGFAESTCNIHEEIKLALDKVKLWDMGLAGKTVGITAGSRGISQIPKILGILVNAIKEAGGIPVLIPCMGSHGGGTVEGQRDILASLGIVEETIGAPIRFCVDTVKIGETLSGIPVYCNKEAVKLDGLVIINRIKTHTDFSGEIESGICKMFAIGLGSAKGALTAHSHALLMGYEQVITEIAGVMVEKLPVLFAMGILENWKGETAKIEGILPNEIVEKEKYLLREYKSSMTKLPFPDLDVLIVGEMGKNISGTGMDTKVIGRIHVKGQKEPDSPKIGRIVVLKLTPESHGNAIGIGLADITTEKVFKSVELRVTAFNSITSMAPEQGFLPCVVENDREAILAAINTSGAVDQKNVRLMYIKNTSSLEYMAISEALLSEVQQNKRIQILGEPEELQFDAEGNLTNFLNWPL